MKKVLACLLWATCLLPNLTYAQIDPKDLVGVWLIDSLDNRKMDAKGYFIIHENGTLETVQTIYDYVVVSKWYFGNGELILRQENDGNFANFFKILALDSKKIVLENHGEKLVFKKITLQELNELRNIPKAKIEKEQAEKYKREEKEKKERLLPFCGTWACIVGKNKITLQLTDDGDFTYRAGKKQASGSWEIEYDVLDIAFSMENNDYKVGRQNYRLQIISQTDKELKTKDFLTQTVLVWRR